MAENTRPTVVVSALTYRRPEMLRQLLRSLATLDRPTGWQVRFLIVDNDSEGSARPVVDEFAALYGGMLDYVIEKEPGIPLARNRALDEAMARGARLLCFIDDDEYPAPDWLCQLVRHFEKTGAVLMSGPVRPLMPDRSLSRWQRFLARGIIGRAAVVERRCAMRGAQGRPMMIATCNWLGDLDWIRSAAIRFDVGLQFTGGSDTAFFKETEQLGGKVAWCETAIVSEHIAPERLSLRYQLNRARAQAIVHQQLSTENSLRTLAEHSARMCMGLALMAVPVLGSASLLIGAQLVGRALGRFAGMRGARSGLYLRAGTATHKAPGSPAPVDGSRPARTSR